MARSRKLWTPKPKPKAKPKATAKPAKVVWKPTRPVGGRSSREVLWVPERDKSQPVPAPNKRVLADLSKLKPAREEHGWRFEDLERQRRKGRWEVGERWTCDYLQANGVSGCKSFVWKRKPEPGQYHAWDCPYWQHEGKDHQPF